MSMDEIIRQEARLIILRELNSQTDGRLNSSLLQKSLEIFGVNKSRAWVHEELSYLKDVGACEVHDFGSVRVAELTQKGRDHVERRHIIEGVKRPSAAGG